MAIWRAVRGAGWTVGLLMGLATAATAQDDGFAFAGLSLQSDLAALTARYPRSTRVGNHVSIRPEESHDHVYGVEVQGDGPGRRLRILFERPAGVPSPDGTGRYPTCAQVQRTIERTYGSPASIMEFADQSTWREDRLWQRGAEQLRLICFGARGRPGSLLAQALVIAPVDR